MGIIADLLKEIPSAARYKSELEAMEKENIALKAEVSVLKSENVNLRQEIQRRDDIIEQEKSHGNNLEELKEKILLLLTQHEELEVEQIAGSLNIGSQLATYHLEELKNSSMIRDYYAVGSPVFWALDQAGRTYLVKRGLLA